MKNIKSKIMVSILLCFVLLMTIVGLVGCGGNDYESYLSSVEKTKQIKRASEEVKIDVALDFNLENFDEEAKNEINKLKDMSYKGIMKYDDNQEIFENNMYTKLGGVGFDSTVYGKEDDILIELTSIGKYIKLSDLKEETNFNDINFSDETIKKIEDTWNSYVNSENVFKGENILVDTPSGVVKSKKYSVEFGNEWINFLNEVMTIIKEDAAIENLMNDEKFGEKAYNLDEMIILNTEEAEVEYLIYEAFVDADGYVVKEDMRFKINYDDPYFKGVTFDLSGLLYNINKEQKIKFPEVSDAEILDVKDFSTEAPVLFDMMN